MIPIKTESAWRGTADCRNCGIRDMVLFADLNEDDFDLIHTPIDELEFAAGDSLQRMGDQTGSLMMLKAGMVKLVRAIIEFFKFKTDSDWSSGKIESTLEEISLRAMVVRQSLMP